MHFRLRRENIINFGNNQMIPNIHIHILVNTYKIDQYLKGSIPILPHKFIQFMRHEN